MMRMCPGRIVHLYFQTRTAPGQEGHAPGAAEIRPGNDADVPRPDRPQHIPAVKAGKDECAADGRGAEREHQSDGGKRRHRPEKTAQIPNWHQAGEQANDNEEPADGHRHPLAEFQDVLAVWPVHLRPSVSPILGQGGKHGTKAVDGIRALQSASSFASSAAAWAR